MLDKLKISNNNPKMNILYIFLIISNIILFIGIFSYYSKVGISVDIELINNFATILATVTILGFITSRLARLKERDGVMYDFGYVLILTIVGLMSSYFNASFDAAVRLAPYLEMFRSLCVILIFAILSLLLKPIKEILTGKYNKKNILICLIIFTILGIYSSRFTVPIDGAPANIRCMLVLISSLLGGPYIGVPVGILSGAYRFTLGGVTALPCFISTVLSGIIGSLVFIWNDKKFPKPTVAIALMFLLIGFEMLVVVILTPPDISFPYITKIYPVMLFSSIIGMMLFSLIVRDERQKLEEIDEYEELEINEMELAEEVKGLKNEIAELKSEISELKKEKSD